MQGFFPIKGRTVKGEIVLFNITDAPFRLSETQIVLRERPNTQLIKSDSIGRCSDMYTVDGDVIAEGDIVTSGDDPTQYSIKWINGFRACTGNVIIPVKDITLPRIVGHGVINNARNYLYYKANNIRWNLLDIVGVDTASNQLILNRKDLPSVNIDDVNQIFMYKSSPIQIGSTVLLMDGRLAEVGLHFGELVIKVDGRYLPYSEALLDHK